MIALSAVGWGERVAIVNDKASRAYGGSGIYSLSPVLSMFAGF